MIHTKKRKIVKSNIESSFGVYERKKEIKAHHFKCCIYISIWSIRNQCSLFKIHLNITGSCGRCGATLRLCRIQQHLQRSDGMQLCGLFIDFTCKSDKINDFLFSTRKKFPKNSRFIERNVLTVMHRVDGVYHQLK